MPAGDSLRTEALRLTVRAVDSSEPYPETNRAPLGLYGLPRGILQQSHNVTM